MSQFSPEGASLEQRQSFQTELLELTMDIIHMLSHEEENNTHLIAQGRITVNAEAQTDRKKRFLLKNTFCRLIPLLFNLISQAARDRRLKVRCAL